ncbi:MAG: hypothetical protein HQM08_22475 [Candidatus Riflebacteria bacterium]|nr:hypothetical protein [Candidatus Riflebacteria bacterium]
MQEKIGEFERKTLIINVFLVTLVFFAAFAFWGRLIIGIPFGAALGALSFRILMVQARRFENPDRKKTVWLAFLTISKLGILFAIVAVMHYFKISSAGETAIGLFLSQIGLMIAVFGLAKNPAFSDIQNRPSRV